MIRTSLRYVRITRYNKQGTNRRKTVAVVSYGDSFNNTLTLCSNRWNNGISTRKGVVRRNNRSNKVTTLCVVRITLSVRHRPLTISVANCGHWCEITYIKCRSANKRKKRLVPWEPRGNRYDQKAKQTSKEPRLEPKPPKEMRSILSIQQQDNIPPKCQDKNKHCQPWPGKRYCLA